MAIFQPKWRGPDGETVTGKVWWMDAWIGNVRHRRSLGTRDKNAASIMAGEIVKRLEMKEAGVPVFEGTADARPLDLVNEYEEELRRRGSAGQHVQRTIQRLRDLLDGTKRLSEVTPTFIRRALSKVAEKGLSAATQNGYRVALSGLFGWLLAEERWPSNPVAHVERVAQSEPTRTRRALTREELDRLVAAAGRRRGVAYVFAATTGLRRSEMAALRWSDVDLDDATVTVRATTAKNRKDAVQPLPPGTVAALRAYRGLRQPGDRVFDSVPSTKGLRADLRAAGLPYDDGTGTCDFHALRATYATLLARGGVPLVQAQRLMRHSTPALTANVYTKLRIEDAREAVARLEPAAAPARVQPTATT